MKILTLRVNMNTESSESAGKWKGLKYNPRLKQTVLKTEKNTLAFKPTCEIGALPEHTLQQV